MRVGAVVLGFVEGVVVISAGVVADRRLLPVVWRALVAVAGAIASFVRVGSVVLGFVEGVVVIIVGIVAQRRQLPVARAIVSFLTCMDLMVGGRALVVVAGAIARFVGVGSVVLSLVVVIIGIVADRRLLPGVWTIVSVVRVPVLTCVDPIVGGRALAVVAEAIAGFVCVASAVLGFVEVVVIVRVIAHRDRLPTVRTIVSFVRVTRTAVPGARVRFVGRGPVVSRGAFVAGADRAHAIPTTTVVVRIIPVVVPGPMVAGRRPCDWHDHAPNQQAAADHDAALGETRLRPSGKSRLSSRYDVYCTASPLRSQRKVTFTL